MIRRGLQPVVLSCILAITAHNARAQFDFTSDGRPDLILTTVEDSRIRWYAQDLISSRVVDLGHFGQAGWIVHLGAWIAPQIPLRAYVTRDKLGQFELFGEGLRVEYDLGKFTLSTETLVILGRDSNGDATAAVADVDGDGADDLLVTCHAADSFISIVGPVQPNPQKFFHSVGNDPRGIASGDFNHDGYVDVALVNQDDGTMMVFLGLPKS